MFLKVLYSCLVVLNFLYLIALVAHHHNRVSVFYIALFASIFLTDFGYLQMSFSLTAESAITANQTLYLGASFSSFFLFMCLADLCKTKVPAWVPITWLALCSFILICVLHPALNRYFYTSVRFTRNRNGVGMLMKQYGPLHLLYILSLLVATLGSLYIIAASFVKKRQVSLITSWTLLGALLITVMAYIIEKTTRMEIPVVPIGYAVCEPVILLLLHRIRLYQTDAIAQQFHVEQDSAGYLVLSEKGSFLGCNDIAHSLFPELSSLRIDSMNNKVKVPILIKARKWVDGKNTKIKDSYWEKSGKGKDKKVRYITIQHRTLLVDRRTVHVFKLTDETDFWQAQQQDKNTRKQMKNDLQSKNAKIRSMENDIITSLASFVENRDGSTGGHIERTSDIVQVFTEFLQETDADRYTPDMYDRIVRAAPLHDFGKIAVPDNVLNKPARLNDDEFAKMKVHSQKGAEMVEEILQHAQDIEFKNVAVNVARYHHEKWDGSGYPDGLAGDKIPYEARIMALADSFDAMVSTRIYQKNPKTLEEAFNEISRCSGGQFDPVLAQHFIACRSRIEHLYPDAILR